MALVKYLTPSSQDKLSYFRQWKLDIEDRCNNSKIHELYTQYQIHYDKMDLTITRIIPNLNTSHKIQDFYQNINQTHFVIQGDITSLAISFRRMKIFLHFLDTSSERLIHHIIKAIYLFCTVHPYNYHQLNIYFWLNNHRRMIPVDLHSSDPNALDYLRTHDLGLNYSGVTYFDSKEIIVVKAEEIIKLLYHELIHYSQQDSKMGMCPNNLVNIDQNSLDLREAYTEFLSIINHSCFQTCYLKQYLDNPSRDYRLLDETLNYEISYSLFLVANIFKFYRLNHREMIFHSSSIKKKIRIFPEYVLIRSILMLHINQWNDFTMEDVMKLIHQTDICEKLDRYMHDMLPRHDSISFIMLEVNFT